MKIPGQNRAVVRDVWPTVENGKYAIKRVVGESVSVWFNVLSDGHDVVRGGLRYRHESERKWSHASATSIGNDRWQAIFKVEKQGTYTYEALGWVDYALTWQHGITKKIDAGLDVKVELLEGLPFIEKLPKTISKEEKKLQAKCATAFASAAEYEEAKMLAKSEHLHNLFISHPDMTYLNTNITPLRVYVDREKAAFSTWYEFFPRSAAAKAGQHGTLQDCIKLLPRVASMGFDTLYFPPIHPIGEIHRKGKNNATTASEGDVGSCWAIGSKDGGHTAIHPQLGTIQDFKQLVDAASKLGIEIAMDFALQFAPDHPWVKEHPQWLKQRPDGTIQYAENPPKKYQDIYPVYFETSDWKNLWKALLDIALYWVEQGIRVFRVDNPHTKPIAFWEWMIAEVKKKNNDVIFLSEAFTTPNLMQELAMAGFTQSYSYYTWRNTKAELVEYMNQLTQGILSETFRPNFWPNTPDILPWSLQNADEHNYLTRYFLAATLSSNVGVYGPVYEFLEHRAMPGKEEYLDSEKYEVRLWDWKKTTPVTELYTKLNKARKEHAALQRTNNIRFCHIENDQLIAYLKQDEQGSKVLCVCSLDAVHSQSGMLHLAPWMLGMNEHATFTLKDVLTSSEFEWHGHTHFIKLTPQQPYHLFVIKEKVD